MVGVRVMVVFYLYTQSEGDGRYTIMRKMRLDLRQVVSLFGRH